MKPANKMAALLGTTQIKQENGEQTGVRKAEVRRNGGQESWAHKTTTVPTYGLDSNMWNTC